MNVVNPYHLSIQIATGILSENKKQIINNVCKLHSFYYIEVLRNTWRSMAFSWCAYLCTVTNLRKTRTMIVIIIIITNADDVCHDSTIRRWWLLNLPHVYCMKNNNTITAVVHPNCLLWTIASYFSMILRTVWHFSKNWLKQLFAWLTYKRPANTNKSRCYQLSRDGYRPERLRFTSDKTIHTS